MKFPRKHTIVFAVIVVLDVCVLGIILSNYLHTSALLRLKGDSGEKGTDSFNFFKVRLSGNSTLILD